MANNGASRNRGIGQRIHTSTLNLDDTIDNEGKINALMAWLLFLLLYIYFRYGSR